MKDKINGRTPEEIKKRLKCDIWIRGGECGDSYDACRTCPLGDACYDACYDPVENAIDSLTYIQQLEAAQPKWISVEEKLPEEDVCVFAAFLYYDGYRIRTARYSVSGEKPIWLIGDMCAIGSTPTHWMPLPEPPKEDA